jgi:hypothetical protein
MARPLRLTPGSKLERLRLRGKTIPEVEERKTRKERVQMKLARMRLRGLKKREERLPMKLARMRVQGLEATRVRRRCLRQAQDPDCILETRTWPRN